MSCLLDTSTLLWFVNDDGALSDSAKDLLENPGIEVHLSLVSIWEIAIKAPLGRGLALPLPFDGFVDAVLDKYDFIVLQISVARLKRVADLPLIHRDPFDRLLIAQSLVEDLPIISNDAAFHQYPIERIW